MIVNVFGMDINISVDNILNFIIDNRVALIPGIIYLIFNKLIPMYIIILIILAYFIFNQFSYNDKMADELKSLKKKINK
jgi:uncharacterized paraquat-inducible protein A